jgi:hypothetical protein
MLKAWLSLPDLNLIPNNSKDKSAKRCAINEWLFGEPANPSPVPELLIGPLLFSFPFLAFLNQGKSRMKRGGTFFFLEQLCHT